jgi:hypothetical protein
MNRRQIALKLILDSLKISPGMSSFDERLALQKSIYLAQQMGVPLGYQFSWYLRGPYSKDLTSDAYACFEAETPQGWDIGSGIKAKLDRFRPFIDSVKRKSNPVRELEKLASVLFVVKTGQASENDTARITARMQAAGKDFDQGEVDGALQTLRRNGFIAAAEDRRR